MSAVRPKGRTMRRTDTIIRIMTFIVFLAIAVYVGYYLYDAYTVPFKTVTAASYRLEDGVESEGYCIREEQVIVGQGENIAVVADEGEKIAGGQQIAVCYLNESALSNAEKLREVELQIQQLQNLMVMSNTDTATAQETVLALSRVVNSGDLEDLDTVRSDVETYVFRDLNGYPPGQLQAELEQLKAQRDTYRAASGTKNIYAEKPGMFSGVIDGLETVTPEAAGACTIHELEDLMEVPETIPTGLGKIITDISWHYATALNAKDAEKLTVGQKVQVSFTKTYSRSVTMTVESVGEVSGGKRVVLFSSNKYLAEVAGVRNLTGRVVFNTVEGIRVPKAAIHLDENGSTYLYLLAGVQTKQVSTEIIGETGEYYIVREDRESGIREGSEIITKAKDLYDGKVVK